MHIYNILIRKKGCKTYVHEKYGGKICQMNIETTTVEN